MFELLPLPPLAAVAGFIAAPAPTVIVYVPVVDKVAFPARYPPAPPPDDEELNPGKPEPPAPPPAITRYSILAVEPNPVTLNVLEVL
jgi:hypothetical protein